MPGQTVLENEEAYTTTSGAVETIVGSDSPSKRSDTYGSSSKIVNSCARASSISCSRLGPDSV